MSPEHSNSSHYRTIPCPGSCSKRDCSMTLRKNVPRPLLRTYKYDYFSLSRDHPGMMHARHHFFHRHAPWPVPSLSHAPFLDLFFDSHPPVLALVIASSALPSVHGAATSRTSMSGSATSSAAAATSSDAMSSVAASSAPPSVHGGFSFALIPWAG
jgi:hypothetical protein